jgi:glutathione S-transferase
LPRACIRRAHVGRPGATPRINRPIPGIKEQGLKTSHGHLKQTTACWRAAPATSIRCSIYGFVFYTWGRRELPMAELKNYTAFKDRMKNRPAVARVLEDEKVKV